MAKLPPPVDLKEPRQEKERRAGRTDPLANRPALGIAYHMPERLTPEWYAFGLIDRALAQGADSLLYDELVRKAGLTGGVDAGINWGLGSMFDYSGPMLWMAQAFHDSTTSSDKLLAAIDTVIERVRKEGLDQATLDRARVKMRSGLYARPRAVRRLRPRQPAGVVRALRRQPGAHQSARNRICQGDAGAGAEDRQRVPASGQSNGLRHHTRKGWSRETGRRGLAMRTASTRSTFTKLAAGVCILAATAAIGAQQKQKPPAPGTAKGLRHSGAEALHARQRAAGDTGAVRPGAEGDHQARRAGRQSARGPRGSLARGSDRRHDERGHDGADRRCAGPRVCVDGRRTGRRRRPRYRVDLDRGPERSRRQGGPARRRCGNTAAIAGGGARARQGQPAA